jgi:methionyl-tRNA formyltransferase
MPDPAAGRGASLCIVVLTQRSPRGQAIAAALTSAGIRIDAIVIDVDRTISRDRAKQALKVLARHGVALATRRATRRLRRVLARRPQKGDDRDRLLRYTDRVLTVPDANGTECADLLTSLAPDLLLLGSSKILRSNILAIPRVGTLNPHPGLLPAYRGLDVIPWALYNGDPLGVTVHLVDPGIDTGDIVAQETFDLQAGDTLRSLRRRADAILARLMTAVVLELMTSGHLTRRAQEPGSGHLYTRMPATLRQTVEATLEAMAAWRI